MRKTKLKKVSKLSQYKIELATARVELTRTARLLKKFGLFKTIPALKTQIQAEEINKLSSAANFVINSQIQARTKNGEAILKAATDLLKKADYRLSSGLRLAGVNLTKKVGRIQISVYNDQQYIILKMQVKIPVVEAITNTEIQALLCKSITRQVGL